MQVDVDKLLNQPQQRLILKLFMVKLEFAEERYTEFYVHVLWMIELKHSDEITEVDAWIILERFWKVVRAHAPRQPASPPDYLKKFLPPFTTTLNSIRNESFTTVNFMIFLV